VDLPQIGLQHPRVRQLRAILRNSSPGRHRLFIAEGLWAHRVLLSLDVPAEVFLWCPQAVYSEEAHRCGARVAARAGSAYRISPRVLDRLTERDRPDGMVSLVRLPSWDSEAVALNQRSLVLVADAIELPGNLGALLRSLDACGGDCLVLTGRRTRLSHPRVFRGSRGMSLRVPVIEFDEPGPAVRWLLRRRFAVYLATTNPDALPYRDVDYPARTALVVGNERCGISPEWYRHGFTEVTVPMLGAADSLNVSVCASLLMYEARARADGW
jgi:TrmH family RNA methyltransferase